jgi:alanine dehydrogenase
MAEKGVGRMIPQETLVLTRKEISQIMDFSEYVTTIEEAFRLYAEGKCFSPGILDVAADDGVFHMKAAGIRMRRTYVAVKVNGNFPQNGKRYGLPTIQGVIILSDGVNGFPLAVLDSTEITMNRTGAATAVAAKYLARADSCVVTICGCGKQGKIQLIALKHVLPLRQVYAFDRNEDAAEKFAEEMRNRIEVPVHVISRSEEGTRQSDVIVTCTTSREFFLRKEDVPPGAFVAAVGADSHDKQELDPQLMVASKVVADILDQSATIGDLHHAIKAGLMTKKGVYGELGEIIAGKKSGRKSKEEIIILDSTGTAIQDVAAAARIYERAKTRGTGTWLSLIA